MALALKLESVEDLAQEIFIITWRKLSSLREPSRFKAWLYGIARNRINNAFRQQNRNAVTAAPAQRNEM